MSSFSIFLGNLFEHYDTALFGFLSPFLAPLIFPQHDPLTALILTYAMIPLGMLARPLGSLFLGSIGDQYGREKALFISLLGMGIISLLIAFSPTYNEAGIFAPLFFCLGRVLQNFLAAGESMGGAIFLLENAPPKRHDLLSSFFSASTIGGYLLASFGVFFVHYANIPCGWRMLYLFGSITALCGAFIRRSMKGSARVLEKKKNPFWEYRIPFLLIVITSGFSYATYSIALVLMNGLIPLVTSFSKAEVIKLNTYLLIFDFAILPLFGWLASKVSREKWMLIVALVISFLSMPLITLLSGASFGMLVLLRVVFVVFGVAFFAPFHAWVQTLVPPHSRYRIISLGYAVGSQLFGGITTPLALWCFKKTGMIGSVSWYWTSLGILTATLLWLRIKKTRSSYAGESRLVAE